MKKKNIIQLYLEGYLQDMRAITLYIRLNFRIVYLEEKKMKRICFLK